MLPPVPCYLGTINPEKTANAWCVYIITNTAKEVIFICPSKFTTSLSMRDLVSNPCFDPNQIISFEIFGVYTTHTEAKNAASEWMRNNYYPIFNRVGRYTKVICNETGQTFRNQSEVARLLGLNQSQLSHHMNRWPGFKKIKGLTFSKVPSPQSYVQSVQFPPAVQPYPVQSPVASPQPSSGYYFDPLRRDLSTWPIKESELPFLRFPSDP